LGIISTPRLALLTTVAPASLSPAFAQSAAPETTAASPAGQSGLRNHCHRTPDLRKSAASSLRDLRHQYPGALESANHDRAGSAVRSSAPDSEPGCDQRQQRAGVRAPRPAADAGFRRHGRDLFRRRSGRHASDRSWNLRPAFGRLQLSAIWRSSDLTELRRA